MTSEPFVPPEFVVPLRLETPQFVLEPLGPQHNDADYDAWSSSMEHIHGTPGWEESSWPRSMTLDENRADLERHAAARIKNRSPDGSGSRGDCPGWTQSTGRSVQTSR